MSIKYKLLLSKKEQPEYFSRDEFEETTEFLLLLEELKAYYTGEIVLFFDNKSINISLDYEFIVEYEEIYQLIQALKSNSVTRYDLYFSEQGSEYYLVHRLINNDIYIYLKRKNEEAFYLGKLLIKDYIKMWESIFLDICVFIQKNIISGKNNPVLLEYINEKKIQDVFYPVIKSDSIKVSINV